MSFPYGFVFCIITQVSQKGSLIAVTTEVTSPTLRYGASVANTVVLTYTWSELQLGDGKRRLQSLTNTGTKNNLNTYSYTCNKRNTNRTTSNIDLIIMIHVQP